MDPLTRLNELTFHSPDDGGGNALDTGTPQEVVTPQDNTETSDVQVESAEVVEESTNLGLLADADKAKQEVPEKYESFTDANGEKVSDAEQEMLSELAKEIGLSQEAAVTATQFADKLIDKMAAQIEATQKEEETAQRAKFAEAWKASDPDGVKTVQADEAFKKLPQEHQEALKESGMLHNNVIVSLLAENGRLSREGRSISGKPAQQQSVMYKNTPELYS